MSVEVKTGDPVILKLKVLYEGYQKILNLGRTIFPRIKISFYTELDPMKKQVPGWHEDFYQKDIIGFMS